MDFSTLSTNLATFLGAMLVSVVGYAWHKARGDAQRSLANDLRDLLGTRLDAAVMLLLADTDDLATIEAKLTQLGRKAVAATGANPDDWALAIGLAVHFAMAKAEDELLRRTQLAKNLATIADGAAATAAKLRELPPNVAIDTITPALAAGVKLYDRAADIPDAELGGGA